MINFWPVLGSSVETHFVLVLSKHVVLTTCSSDFHIFRQLMLLTDDPHLSTNTVGQKDRQTGRQKDLQSGRQTHSRRRDRQTDMETDRQTIRQTDTQAGRQIDMPADRCTDIHIGNQTDRDS